MYLPECSLLSGALSCFGGCLSPVMEALYWEVFENECDSLGINEIPPDQREYLSCELPAERTLEI
jgi:hypothetical protein